VRAPLTFRAYNPGWPQLAPSIGMLRVTSLLPRAASFPQTEPHSDDYNKRLYRMRKLDRTRVRTPQNHRAIATRYDQLAESFLAMLYLAAARSWIKLVHAA
jgi:hypothetical protein